MKVSPAFQFYPSDFLNSTVFLSAAAVGSFIRMLSVAWEHGPIQDSPTALMKAMGLGPCDPPFDVLWAELRSKWTLTGDGWINNRLERVRADRIAFLGRQSTKGKLSGQSRKRTGRQPDMNPGSTGALTGGTTGREPEPQPEGQPDGQPETNPLSLSLSLPSSLSTSLPLNSENGARALTMDAPTTTIDEHRALVTYNPHTKSTNLINGADQRKHAQHGWCDPEWITCVPAQLHRELMARARKSDSDMRSFYVNALIGWGDQPRNSDVFKFWNRMVDTWIGATLPAPVADRTSKGARTADAFRRAVAKLQADGRLSE